MTTRTFYGWAVSLHHQGERPYLAGVLYWGEPPKHCAAVRTAVFATRREARAACVGMESGGYSITPKRVKVTIEATP